MSTLLILGSSNCFCVKEVWGLFDSFVWICQASVKELMSTINGIKPTILALDKDMLENLDEAVGDKSLEVLRRFTSCSIVLVTDNEEHAFSAMDKVVDLAVLDSIGVPELVSRLGVLLRRPRRDIFPLLVCAEGLDTI
jgi:hypothetical protein